jgi:3-oxoacyl-[acyl-carrier-protein] synthase II
VRAGSPDGARVIPGRRVVVTGMGAVSAAGAGVAAFWESCLAGREALRPARIAGSRPAMTPVGEVTAPIAGAGGRAAGFAETAAAEAVARAAPGPAGVPRDAGIVVGTCLGGAGEVLAWIDAMDGAARAAGPAGSIRPGGFGSIAWGLAERYALEGPVVSLSSACTSGLAAIAHAAETIRRGEADCMLAGGVDALSEFVLSGFDLLRALTAERVRPFDRRRDGLALGEGAGILVLEERRRAVARGAPILAEVAGCGSAADAHHMRGPSPEGDGLARAMDAALRDGGQAAGGIEFIAAHATGTIQNDRMEARAIRRLFGETATRIPVTSVTPIVGHTLGAAGVLAAILCVEAMRDGRIPPIVGCEEPEAGIDLDLVRGAARPCSVRAALAVAAGFAGHNAAILLRAPSGGAAEAGAR